MLDFPRELRLLIAEKNIKHKDLAGVLEVTPTTISNWLRGGKIKLENALRLHDYSHGQVSMEAMGYGDY